MTAAIIGTVLILLCVAVFCWSRLPSRRSTKRQRDEALRRYARDVDAD